MISFLILTGKYNCVNDGGNKQTHLKPRLRCIGGSDLVKINFNDKNYKNVNACLLYTSPSPRDKRQSRMPSSA